MSWLQVLERAALAAVAAGAAFIVQHAADIPGRCGCGPAMTALAVVLLDIVRQLQKGQGPPETPAYSEKKRSAQWPDEEKPS